MNITFIYSEREFRSAMKQSQGESKRLVFDIILAIALLSYGLYETINGSYELFNAFVVFISLLYLFVIFARAYIVPTLLFRREPKYNEEYAISFLEDEINFTAGNLKSTLTWNFYSGLKESKDFIYLIYGKKRYTIIPKRVFKGNEEINEFKQLIKSKINKVISMEDR